MSQRMSHDISYLWAVLLRKDEDAAQIAMWHFLCDWGQLEDTMKTAF